MDDKEKKEKIKELISQLEKGIESAKKEGWIREEEVEKELSKI